MGDAKAPSPLGFRSTILSKPNIGELSETVYPAQPSLSVAGLPSVS
jgi:hypothetical protein